MCVIPSVVGGGVCDISREREAVAAATMVQKPTNSRVRTMSEKSAREVA